MNLLLRILPTKYVGPEFLSGLVLVKVITKTTNFESMCSDIYHLGDVLLIPVHLMKKVELDGEELFLITHQRLFEYQTSLIAKLAN